MARKTLLRELMKETRLKLIRHLMENQEEKQTLKDLEEATGITYKTVKNAVDALENYGFIETERKGNYRMVSVNQDSPYVAALGQLLELETRPFKEVAENFAETIHERYKDEITAIILFGSVARGIPSSESDIDIAIIVRDEKSQEEVEEEAWSLRDKYERDEAMQINPLVMVEEKFKREARNGSPLEKRITEEGKVIKGEIPQWQDQQSNQT